MQVRDALPLSEEQVRSILALVEAATRSDAVAPLSEQVLLQVRDDAGRSPARSASSASRHLLAYDGARLVGYAHLTPAAAATLGTPAEPATAELVVAVTDRRRGVGKLLLHTLQDRHAPLQVWSHGHLPAARAFAGREGYTVVRELWQLRRPLGPLASRPEPSDTELPHTELPDGFRSRSFVVGQDEPAWLAVNARAFAHHPEQGRITLPDLQLRQHEPWFDPAGFLLVEDIDADPPVLAAFHWTKVHQPTVQPMQQLPGQPVGRAGDTEPSEPVGEVYVLGVDPAYQGRRLSRPLTVLGLRYLQDRGLRQVLLYVDAANLAAVRTYTGLGFREWSADALYLRTTSG